MVLAGMECSVAFPFRSKVMTGPPPRSRSGTLRYECEACTRASLPISAYR